MRAVMIAALPIRAVQNAAVAIRISRKLFLDIVAISSVGPLDIFGIQTRKIKWILKRIANRKRGNAATTKLRIF